MVGTQSTGSRISPHPQHSCSETVSVPFKHLLNEGRLPGAIRVVTGPQGTRLPSRARQGGGGVSADPEKLVLLCLGVTVPLPPATQRGPILSEEQVPTAQACKQQGH